MQMRHRFFGLVAFGLLASIASAAQIENPFFKSWALCKPGTSVTLRSTRGAGTTQRVTEMKYTLVEVKPDECLLNIEMTTEVRGAKRTMPATNQKFPRELESTPDILKAKEAIDHASNVSVTVPAGTYKVKFVDKPAGSDAAVPFAIKMWVSLDVPGGTVKTETSRGAADSQVMSTTELIAIERK